jgi:hypothetical protein
MTSHHRPHTLVEVADWSSSWQDLSSNLVDFLHEFSARPSAEMLEGMPRLLASVFPGGNICDAYLAATAATLAARIGRERPRWVDAPERYLHTPWFASPGPAMRACLLLESPARFRERNLFVTANALSVA